MNTLWQDLRYGARMLLKAPAVTLVAVIALTLGIGANTALFSVVHAVLLRSLPYVDGDRLAIVWENKRSGTGNPQNVINLGNFYDWKEQNSVFVDMAAFFDRNVNLTSDGEPEEVPGQIATTNLFSVLGVNALRGRTFTPDDGKDGQPDVVVISYNLWQRRFGGAEVLGRKITEQEAKEMRHVVVVNETFARKNLPGQDPLGKRVTIVMKDENVPTEIIGVVGDTKHLGLDTENEEMAYWPQPELRNGSNRSVSDHFGCVLRTCTTCNESRSIGGVALRMRNA